MSTDMLKDEEILNQSQERNDSFIGDEPSIGQLKLRPFTAGSLLICRRVGNKLITGGQTEDAEFDVLSFIYIHSAPKNEVKQNAYNKEKFWNAVIDWADKLKISDIQEAGKVIENIINQSGLGIVVPVDDGKSSGGKDSPN